MQNHKSGYAGDCNGECVGGIEITTSALLDNMQAASIGAVQHGYVAIELAMVNKPLALAQRIDKREKSTMPFTV